MSIRINESVRWRGAVGSLPIIRSIAPLQILKLLYTRKGNSGADVLCRFEGAFESRSSDASARCRTARRAFSASPTSDVDEAAEQIGRIFCPHDLKPLLASTAAASLRRAQLRRRSTDSPSTTWPMADRSRSNPGCLERFFLVQLPLSRIDAGVRRLRAGHSQLCPDATASLLSPTLPTRMVWENDCAQLILLFERKLVEQRAAALAGKSGASGRVRPA